MDPEHCLQQAANNALVADEIVAEELLGFRLLGVGEVERVGDVDPPLLVHAAHGLGQIYRPLPGTVQPVDLI